MVGVGADCPTGVGAVVGAKDGAVLGTVDADVTMDPPLLFVSLEVTGLSSE